jgi:hypothetical protein
MIIEQSIQQVAAKFKMSYSVEPDRQFEIGIFAYTQMAFAWSNHKELVIRLSAAKFDNDEINKEVEIAATQTAIKYLHIPEFSLYSHDGYSLRIDWL